MDINKIENGDLSSGSGPVLTYGPAVQNNLLQLIIGVAKDNEIAIEKGLRAEIVEDFITGLKGLFEEHYIDIPEDKVDVIGELTEKVDELESALNEQISRGIELSQALNEQKKIEAIYTACEGLTQTQVEKMKSLAEGVDFTTEEEFTTKLDTLKESYFKADVKVATTDALSPSCTPSFLASSR